MIIKIKKRFLVSLLLMLLLFLILLITPVAYSAYTGQVNGSFGVELWITNRNPVVILVNATGFQVDPTDSGDVKIIIVFNATDSDAVTQINASKAVINLTLGTPGGNQWRSNISNQGGEFGTCYNHTESDVVVINCTVTMRYYDNTSNKWVINISIEDINGGVGRNDSEGGATPHVFTYNELSALSLPHKWINFTNLNVGDTDKPAYPHIILNNTGNDDFDQINITGANLIGQSTAESISISSFVVNTTNVTAGKGVQLATSVVTIRELEQPAGHTQYNATLIHGHTSAKADYDDDEISAKGNRSLFFWITTVPSVSAQKYNNTWNITVIDAP